MLSSGQAGGPGPEGPLAHSAKRQIRAQLETEQKAALGQIAQIERLPGRINDALDRMDEGIMKAHAIAEALENLGGRLLGKRQLNNKDGIPEVPPEPVSSLDQLDQATHRMNDAIDRLQYAAMFLEEL